MSRFRSELRTAGRPARAADLIARGVSRHALEGSRWRRTSRGFYLPASVEAASPTQRILEAAAVMPPNAALAGWSAAFALGADVIDGLDDHTLQPRPVTIILPTRAHRQAVRGIDYVAEELKPGDVVVLSGIPFTHRVRTAMDLARWAPNLTEAVVALDALLKAKILTQSRLRTGLAGLVGRRGARQARRAVELCRPSVRSSWESRLRMLYVLDLGLPCPMVNQPVFTLGARFLGEPDLLDVEAGLAMEYDGARWPGSRVEAGHRDRDQHRQDNVREEAFERAGLIVARADKADLTRHRRQLGERLLAARADGTVRDRARDRWTLRQPPDWFGIPA